MSNLPSLPPQPLSPPESFNLASYLIDDRIAEGHEAACALVCPEGEWSYGEVYEHANRFAWLFIEAGVRPEERVLLSVRDSADFVGAFLGILKVGAVVVMISPELKVAQLKEMLNYSRARLVIVERGIRDSIEEAYQTSAEEERSLTTIIEVEGGARRAKGEASAPLQPSPSTPSVSQPTLISAPEHLPRLPITPICASTHRDDPAIWLFSGGTTGRPKAIVQPHRSFVYTTERYGKRVMGYRAEDRTLSVPKLYFGYATGANLIFPLSVGASTILFPDKPTPERLFELIERHRPTLLINVPTLINRMINTEGAERRDLSSLRAVTSAGEALPTTLHESWDALYGSPLYDGLGTAEMWHIFLTNRPGASRRGSLGRAVEGFEISLKGGDGAEVARGEEGVMWVRGGARALCYWRQLDASFEAFRGSWYASGDLLRQDKEGFYYYCGRQDDMIKVAGKWVSPKEVEDQLMTHEAVAECAVIGRRDEAGLLKAYAFVIPRESDPHQDATQEAQLLERLRAHLSERLDRYKLPKLITLCASFERTHLGKIDRGALKRRST